jgi:hypothetical protein
MKQHRISWLLTGAIAAVLASPLAAQTPEPPPAVPALESGINLHIVLTSTGVEKTSGPESARVHTADFDVTRMIGKDFVALLDEKYDLVDNPKDYALVAVLVETATEDGYRFYLKNKKNGGAPAYVYLSPEIIGFTVDASAGKYREVHDGEALKSGNGRYKHAVTVDTAGFETKGVASGGYEIRNVTVDGVTAQLSVPNAMKVTTTGFYTENTGTPQEKTYIAETSWTFNAGKKVDLNDYPAPPAPEPDPLPVP